MTSSWRQRLRSASFRNVPFHVDATTIKGGRRLVTHEFPNRDDYLIEDLGGVPKEFSINAYIYGDDFDIWRVRLADALNKKGAGTLIHPTFGNIEVRVKSFDSPESKDRQNAATFSIEFIREGKNLTWGTRIDTKFKTGEACDKLRKDSIAAFNDNYDREAVDWVNQASADDFAEYCNGVIDEGVLDAADEEESSILDDIGEATSSGVEWLADGGVETIFDGYDAVAEKNPRAMISLADKSLEGAEAYAPKIATKNRAIEAKNRNVLNTTCQCAALSGKARALSNMDFETQEEAAYHRDKFIKQSAEVSRRVSGSSNMGSMARTVTPGLNNLRNKSVVDVTERGANAAYLKDYKSAAPRSALVAAYDEYEDAGRASDLIKRVNGGRGYKLQTSGKILSI